MKRILIVEPQSSGLLLINAALEAGHCVWVATAESGERSLSESIKEKISGYFVCETSSENEILTSIYNMSKEMEEGFKFDAIIAGFEYYVSVCASISDKLGLAGMLPEDAESCRLKNLMRTRLKEKNIEIPQFIWLKPNECEEKIPLSFPFPAIVKPVNMSGSMHVYKVSSIEEAADAINKTRKSGDCDLDLPVSHDLLVEEYIDGDEFSIEGIVDPKNADVHVWSVTRKILGGQTGFVEIGHIVGEFSDVQKSETMISYCKKVVFSLGITRGAFHAEIRWCHRRNLPILMEIGARLAGDSLPSLISEARGISFASCALNSMLGNSVEYPTSWVGASAICFLLNNLKVTSQDMANKIERKEWKYLKEIKWHPNYEKQLFGDFRDRICTAKFHARDILKLEEEVQYFLHLVQ